MIIATHFNWVISADKNKLGEYTYTMTNGNITKKNKSLMALLRLNNLDMIAVSTITINLGYSRTEYVKALRVIGANRYLKSQLLRMFRNSGYKFRPVSPNVASNTSVHTAYYIVDDINIEVNAHTIGFLSKSKIADFDAMERVEQFYNLR